LGHKEKTEKPNEISGITDGNEKSMFTLYIWNLMPHWQMG
jgi:hypothetical protein